MLFLGPDPVILPWIAVASPTGSAAIALAVPSGPAWIGLDVFVQALTLSASQGPGLTNVVHERIMP